MARAEKWVLEREVRNGYDTGAGARRGLGKRQ